jgi:hypothetical protein
VLRFFCVWDDRAALYGDRRPYRLHLFPDGSVEILETRDGNSGRDPFPVFLRRGLLPKPVRGPAVTLAADRRSSASTQAAALHAANHW